MKTYLTFLSLFLFSFSVVYAQTAMRVYEIFQQKCVQCHNNISPQSGLDLEGAGATIQQKMLDVYNTIHNTTPANSFAASKGYKYIYPGRPDRSFLFRKVNNQLEPTIDLDNAENQAMPPLTEPQLTQEERELIRQWVLFGAPPSGEVVDEQLISDYYSTNGLASFPDGPPPAPAAGEGFQIKMGPFYLKPAGQFGDELEYFQKYELDLPDNIDVNRLDIHISNFSHHLIVYDFDFPAAASAVPPGLRNWPYHFNIGLSAAVQEATDLKLPEGTAFIWDNDLVLDLNAHYINYSSTNTYQAEAYVNVYTQPAGTAAQEMKTELFVNESIFIPNNGDLITHTDIINPTIGEVYLWGLMGHTHKYGQGYQVYTRKLGQQDELIYDASCPQGTPGCVAPFFDYQHIPLHFYEPFYPVEMNWANGLIHKAQWINDGPSSVNFGLTSDDEMMVLIAMYVEDSTGVDFPVAAHQPAIEQLQITIAPNPMTNSTTVTIPKELGISHFTLYDMLGRVVYRKEQINSQAFIFQRNKLQAGMYVYRLDSETGRQMSGKLMIE